jgi:hypothetical protein
MVFKYIPFLLILVEPVTEEDLDYFTVKQLKQFLKERAVECQGCIEKSHWLETAKYALQLQSPIGMNIHS